MGRAPNTTAPDAATTGPAASALIDQRIAHLGDWRGQALTQVRQLIHEAAPGVVEEWKWRGTPVWSLGGILCTGESWSLLTASQGARSGLCGMGCKARCAANSSAIGKRRNAADHPQRPLPEGLERNRAIERPGCLHGHEPMQRIRSIHSSRLRANAIPWEAVNRL